MLVQKVEVKRQESHKLSKKALRWVTVSMIRNWTKVVWVRENGCADGQTWVLAHRGQRPSLGYRCPAVATYRGYPP